MSKKMTTSTTKISPLHVTSLLELTCEFLSNDGKSVMNLSRCCKSIDVTEESWRKTMIGDLGLDEPLKPVPGGVGKMNELNKEVKMLGVGLEKCTSNQEAYCTWREYFRRRFDRKYANRPSFRKQHIQAAIAWSSLKKDLPDSITSKHIHSRIPFRFITQPHQPTGTFVPGLTCSSFHDIDIPHESDAVLSFFAIYSVFDGQETQMDIAFSNGEDPDRNVMRRDLLRGLFGGYNVYNHLVNMRMLSSDQIIAKTESIPIPRVFEHTSFIPICCSFRHDPLRRCFYLNLRSGEVVSPSNHTHERPYVVGRNILTWFATFANRVRSKYYRITRCVEARSPFMAHCGVNLYVAFFCFCLSTL